MISKIANVSTFSILITSICTKYIYMYTQAKLVYLAPNSVPLCPLANPDLQMSDSVQTDQPLSLVSRSLIKPDLRLTRTTAKTNCQWLVQ